MLVMMVMAVVMIVAVAVVMIVAVAVVMIVVVAVVVIVIVVMIYVGFHHIAFYRRDLVESFGSLFLCAAYLAIVELVDDACHDGLGGRSPLPKASVRTLLLLLMLVIVVVLMVVAVVTLVVMVVVISVVVVMVVVISVVVVMVMVVALSTIEVAVKVIHIVVVRFMGLVQHHVEVARVDGCHLLASDGDFEPFHMQTIQGTPQPRLICSQIEQCAHNHVATDAARAFQIQCLAHVSLPLAPITRPHDR